MKRTSKVLSFLLLAILVAATVYAQQTGSLSGKVIGRDGQPAAQIQVKIDQLYLNNGRIAIRDSQIVKTGRNGEYGLSGIQNGRVMITVIEGGQPSISVGEKTGDEIYIANGLDKRIPTLDLTKAPPLAPAVAAAVDAGKMTDAERKAMREKIEKEAAAAGEATKAFDAGKAAFAAKDYPEAIKNFKAAAEKQPSQDVIWANLGNAYDKLASDKMSKSQRDPDADARAAGAKEAQQAYEDSVAAYQKALELKPIESAYYLNLSLAQIGGGKLDDAKTTIEKSAAIDPANAGKAYYNLGASLINKNKHDDAVPFLKKSIELDKTYGPAYFQLGLSGVSKGDPSATEYLQKCLDLPNCPDTATAKGLIDALKAPGAQQYQSDAAKAKAEADAKAKAGQPAKGGKGNKN
jgi:tetratricopeptide (TPR) repeat protein